MTKQVKIDIIAQDKTKQAIASSKKGFDGLKGSIFNVRNALVGLGGGIAIRGLIQTGKEVENLQVRFKFLFGSVKEGNIAFQNLTKFASKVPFSLQEIAKGSGSLAVVAKDADDLNRILKITGNVAAVSGLDFASASEQIQRAFSSGVGAADLFRERGIGALLGFKSGAKVTVKETVEAFEKAFGKGGRFDGATDDLAQTFEGTLSMIGDKFFQFQNDVNATFFNELKSQFKDLDQFFADNEKQIKVFAEQVGSALAKAVTTSAEAMKFLYQNADILKGIFAGIIAFKFAKIMFNIGVAIKGVNLAVLALNGSMRKNLIFGAIGAVVTGIVMAKDALSGFKDEIDETTQSTFDYAEATSHMRKTTEQLNFEDAKAKLEEFRKALTMPTSITKLQDRFKTEEKLLEEKLQKELKILDDHEAELLAKQELKKTVGKELLDSELAQLAEINALKQELEFDHLATIAIMDDEATNKRIENAKKVADEQAKASAKTLEQFKAGKFGEIKAQDVTDKELKGMARHTLQEGARMNKEMFRINQALNIGEAIMNTSKGITAALGTGNIPLAFAIGAMGAIQVATIAQQQPPAQFGGSRLPNSPFLVGEKGPELFTPNTAGSVTPNHQLGGGGATVNFNITTVDAQSFGTLLDTRRGQIVNMINSALNNKGQAALV